MKTYSSFSRFFDSPIPRRAAVTLATLLGLAWIGGLIITSAQNSQPSTCIDNGKAFLAGEFSVSGGDAAAIETKSFTCTPVEPLKKDEKVPAMFELGKTEKDNKLWSVSKRSVQVGTNQVAYPTAAMMASSDGVGHAFLLAVLKAKTDLKAGEKLRADGYQIETARAVKAGDSISVVLIVGNNDISLLSIEADSSGKPWFAAFKDDIKPGGRASAIEIWRYANQHVAQDRGICGF